MQFFYKLFFIVGKFLPAQNPVWAMLLCGTFGLGAFALVFCFLRRRTLRPRAAEFKSGAYKTLLPYGLAIAPTAVLVFFNSSLTQSLIVHLFPGALAARNDAAGLYSYAYTLSNIVTMVQLGFASFWGPYMFEHYKTQQPRIKRVHNYLNLAVLVFFALLVAFEDLIFIILPNYAGAQPIFALMMLSAVFTILCETTVYGNAIARRPIFDTLGFALAFVVNIALCAALLPFFGLYGAAVGIAASNFAMFLFRTLTAQRLYQSIENPAKTVAAVFLAVLLAVAGTVWANAFWPKFCAAAAAALLYCLLYRAELARLLRLALGMAKKLVRRG